MTQWRKARQQSDAIRSAAMASPWHNGMGRAFIFAARIIVGGVFIYASGSKIIDPAAFARAIVNYQILPPMLVNPVALVLPWLELVCGICLVAGFLKRGSALVAAMLLLVFIGALAQSIYRGLDIRCGCFSLDTKGAISGYLDIIRDMVLLAMAGLILWHRSRSIPSPR